MLAQARQFGANTIFVPVVAIEANGHNAIPRQMAEYLAAATGASAARGIVQANKAFHTRAKGMDRMISRAFFTGEVDPSQRYVIVDDTTV